MKTSEKAPSVNNDQFEGTPVVTHADGTSGSPAVIVTTGGKVYFGLVYPDDALAPWTRLSTAQGPDEQTLWIATSAIESIAFDEGARPGGTWDTPWRTFDPS